MSEVCKQQLPTPGGSWNGSLTQFCSFITSCWDKGTFVSALTRPVKAQFQIFGDADGNKTRWRLFSCREVTKQSTLNDKGRCQSLPSLNAPKNKPNFSCCNWSNSASPDLRCRLAQGRTGNKRPPEAGGGNSHACEDPGGFKLICGNNIRWKHSALR